MRAYTSEQSLPHVDIGRGKREKVTGNERRYERALICFNVVNLSGVLPVGILESCTTVIAAIGAGARSQFSPSGATAAVASLALGKT